MQMQITDNVRSNRMLHIHHARKKHVNLDSFISDTVSQRKSSKFHFNIPACECTTYVVDGWFFGHFFWKVEGSSAHTHKSCAANVQGSYYMVEGTPHM